MPKFSLEQEGLAKVERRRSKPRYLAFPLENSGFEPEAFDFFARQIDEELWVSLRNEDGTSKGVTTDVKKFAQEGNHQLIAQTAIKFVVVENKIYFFSEDVRHAEFLAKSFDQFPQLQDAGYVSLQYQVLTRSQKNPKAKAYRPISRRIYAGSTDFWRQEHWDFRKAFVEPQLNSFFRFDYSHE